MAKRKDKFSFSSFLAWIVGILVSLAVGAGMIDKTLTVPFISNFMNGIIIVAAGWIVVIGAIISVIVAIFERYL